MNEKWYVSDTPEKKVYSNKEIEKSFEDIGIFVSYHEEDIGGGKKRGVLTPIKKNIEVLNDTEKALSNGQPVNFQIENSDGKMVEVSKKEFARWMEEGKNIKTPPKESLVYGASGDIDGITYFTEIKGKDGIIRESYYQPRSEEEKKQIKKRQEINKKRREEEKSQEKNFSGEQEKININKEAKTETSPSYDEKDQKLETNTSSNNKGSSTGTVAAASGVLVIVGAGLYYWIKPKKIKK